VSCPYCRRTDTDGLQCDDDHCREDVIQEHGHKPTPQDDVHEEGVTLNVRSGSSGPPQPLNSTETAAFADQGKAGGRVPVLRRRDEATAAAQAAAVLCAMELETVALETQWKRLLEGN